MIKSYLEEYYYTDALIWEFTRIEVSVWNMLFASVVKGRLQEAV